MKLIKYFIRTFGLIFLVAVIGLVVNFNRLAQITEYHDEIQEEWSELESLVSFQNDLNDLISYLSFHQIVQAPSKRVLKNKIQQAKERLEAVEVCALDATSHHSHADEDDDHAEQELELLNKLKTKYYDFVSSSEPYLNAHNKLDMEQMGLELKNLLSVQTNAFALQLVYVEGMHKALTVAESVRQEITNQAIIFSIIIVSALLFGSIGGVVYLRKRTNEALVEQNLLTIGALTKNLIHEIRNPLGIIKSSASVLKKEGVDSENSEELITYMIEEIDRIDGTFKHLLKLQDSENIPFSDNNMSKLIAKVITLFEGEASKHKITIEFIDEKQDAIVNSNENLLRQVLINILLNSIQASREGDKIIVHMFCEGTHLNISVEDFGVGMEQSELKRIFDVFYTTKSKGMGIGLLIVKSIIDRHHGKIDIQSQIGKGTKFTIKLPYKHV